jgi:hypothetical protein
MRNASTASTNITAAIFVRAGFYNWGTPMHRFAPFGSYFST